MKVGDVVYSTKVRPYEKAMIVKVDVTVKIVKIKRSSV